MRPATAIKRFLSNPSFPAPLETVVVPKQGEALTPYLERVKRIFDAHHVNHWWGRKIAVFVRPDGTMIGRWAGPDLVYYVDWPPDSLPPKGKMIWARDRTEAEAGGYKFLNPAKFDVWGAPEGSRVWGVTGAGKILAPDAKPAKGHPNHNGEPMWLAVAKEDGYAV